MPLMLGEPVFTKTSEIRDYCENGRKLIRPLANEFRIASEELKAALKEIPGQSPWLLGADSKVRAMIVARHLEHAAEGVDATCAGLIRTWLSFEKHFLQEHKTRKRAFDIKG